MRTLMLALIGAGLLAAPAAASEDDWPVLKGARLDGQMPWGAFVVYRPAGQVTSGVTLFWRDKTLVARRVETRDGADPVVTWTSSRTCPALAPALAGLERLPAPQIDVPGAGRELGPPNLVQGGSSYFIWVQDARVGGRNAAQLELRAADGSPVAAWMERSLTALAGCWSGAQP